MEGEEGERGRGRMGRGRLMSRKLQLFYVDEEKDEEKETDCTPFSFFSLCLSFSFSCCSSFLPSPIFTDLSFSPSVKNQSKVKNIFRTLLYFILQTKEEILQVPPFMFFFTFLFLLLLFFFYLPFLIFTSFPFSLFPFLSSLPSSVPLP